MPAPEDEAPDFYTVGYSGRDIDSFVAALKDADVACLVDIRFNAVSMYKPAFSRRNLERALCEAGIAYEHMPDLGVPSDIRGWRSRLAAGRTFGIGTPSTSYGATNTTSTGSSTRPTIPSH